MENNSQRIIILAEAPLDAQSFPIMANEEKPIVFLSHSSLDKEPLAALKEILDKRAAGFLNFFLSSDGESIKFGRNWVVSVSDALAQAKLMFVFLSPQSADSKWIHFEAGCAYAKETRVVPVCLPGIDLNRITPPLGLLQGFNLHSHESIGNIVRICNERFGVKIDESFKSEDFESITRNIIGRGVGFFGDQTFAIDSVKITLKGNIPNDDFNPFSELNDLCKKLGMSCHSSARKVSPSSYNQTVFIANFELPGCIGSFSFSETPVRPQTTVQSAQTKIENPPKPYRIEFTLSPELFHVNASVLNQWFEKLNFGVSIHVQIFFRQQIKVETERHHLTTKLHQYSIDALGLDEDAGFKFNEFKFNLSEYNRRAYFSFNLEGKLDNKNLSTVVERLFKSQAIWEHEPSFSEMFGS